MENILATFNNTVDENQTQLSYKFECTSATQEEQIAYQNMFSVAFLGTVLIRSLS